MFDIKEELKKIPKMPGVYLMFDKNDIIIYVGKASILKNRVRQYFQTSNNSIKVKNLVKKIHRFEYIVTKNEVEALILENNLIKKHSPKYNIRLKDDKTYPYLKLSINEMFPKLVITRKVINDKAKYFGPYTNSTLLKENLNLILKIFPLRRCNKKFPRDLNKERPCLNYHIGKCKAPCNLLISPEDYNFMIENVLNFLSGKHSDILNTLENEMLEASNNLEFEKASEIRDKIFAIKSLAQSQLVENTSDDDKDVIAFARADDEAMFQIFFIRGGKITGRENIMLNNISHLTRNDLMLSFVKQFYSGTPFIPKEIILQEEIDDKENILNWLSSLKGKKIKITTPKKNEKLKLVEMAYNNAKLTLERFGEQIIREKQRTVGAIEEIRKKLNLNKYLKRIEAFDISNNQGVYSVGCMVVFEDGKPKKTDYRKFKIKTLSSPDDYGSIQEVIERRFSRYLQEIISDDDTKKFSTLPDIIFVDGGKGQVNAVKKVLNNLNLNILVCGMVKDDFHRTRGLIFNNKEINFEKNSEAFKLVTRIQDEVHRFSIEFHRKLMEKSLKSSILDEISGIGQTRKKNLLKHFGSIDNIKKASIDELKSVSGMNLKSAQTVYEFFSKNKGI